MSVDFQVGLSGLVIDQIGQDVRGGDVFIFLNRHCTSLKALHMEHGGLVIYLYETGER